MIDRENGGTALVVEPRYTGIAEVGSLITKAVVKFQKGELANAYEFNTPYIFTSFEATLYFLISLAAAIAAVLPLAG